MTAKRAIYDHKKAHPDEYITVKSSEGAETRLYIRLGIENVNDMKFRIKDADKAFAHGSYAVGDGKVESRKLKLSCHIKGSSQQAHDQEFNELISLLAQRNYSLRLARSDREYRIAGLTDVKQKWIKGFKCKWSDVDITLLLIDPFAYATTPTTLTHLCWSGTEISIYNPSSIDVPLIFSFTPPEGQSAPDIEISHKESEESFTVKDTLLTSPAIAVVNGETGTVRRNEGNSLNTFSGLFLKALPGQNTYVYRGSECTVGITFTARWFV